MKKVLILAYYFPPMAVSGSMRPAGLCSHLREFGFEPHVISNEISDAIPIDYSLMNLVPSDIKIERVAHIDWMQVLLDVRSALRQFTTAVPGDLSQRDNVAGQYSEDVSRSRSSLQHLIDRLQNHLLLFPDRQKGWIQSVRKHLRRLPVVDRPDVVLATGNPWSALLAGIHAAKLLGVPLVSDFRDPWTQNPASIDKDVMLRAKKFEKLIIAHSSRVIANTEELKLSLAKLYPSFSNKMVTVTNGYHENLGGDLRRNFNEVCSSASIELNYFGSTYELRRPTKLLKALENLTVTEHITNKDLVVQFTGSWGVTDNECNELADRLEEKGILRRCSSVPHAHYINWLRQSQHLLVLQQDFPLQIPAKMYEYIASRRPILLIGGHGATANLVRKKRLGLVCNDEIGTLVKVLRGLIRGDIIINPPAIETIASFGYRSITGNLVSVLNDAVSAK